jgi:GntR family transcriptional regulator, transcriptional activator for L-galactonate catabolism
VLWVAVVTENRRLFSRMSRHPVSPLFAQTQNGLLELLRTELQLGDRLPTQTILATRFDAGRTTIHRILTVLKTSGVIGVAHRGCMVLKRYPTKTDFLPQPLVLSRREGVEQSLISMLVNGRLRPGERFSELALSHEHGVTTGTVREALLNLSRLGVFTKAARKQWTVAQIDGEMIKELMDIRILIESFALSCFFRRSSRPFEVFLGIRLETQKLAQSPNPDRKTFFRLDDELHRAILACANNRYLTNNFQFISFPIQFQFSHYKFSSELQKLGVAQHLALLDAIIRDDEQASLLELRRHLETAQRTLLDLSSSSPYIMGT